MASPSISAEQFASMRCEDCRLELVAGELRKRSYLPWMHGVVVSRLQSCLGEYVEKGNSGLLLGAGCGFLLARAPDTVRAPCIAFLRADRLPDPLPDETYWPGAPDLAVEVVSPNDRCGEIDEKVKAWLDAGTSMVWVIHPARRNVTVYLSATQITTLTENDTLTGGDVVEGFSHRVGDLFAGLVEPGAG